MQYAFKFMVYSSYYKIVFQHNVNSNVEYDTAQEQDCMSEFNKLGKKSNRNKLKMVVK